MTQAQPGNGQGIERMPPQAVEVEQAVLTAWSRDYVESEIARRKLGAYFSSTQGRTDLEATGKLDVAREFFGDDPVPGTVLVGDTLHDAEVAAALGWECG